MSTFTATNKSSATFSGANKSDFGISYLLTDILDNILVGSAENETLILSDGISWAGTNKS
jgi:hypothetical protein